MATDSTKAPSIAAELNRVDIDEEAARQLLKDAENALKTIEGDWSTAFTQLQAAPSREGLQAYGELTQRVQKMRAAVKELVTYFDKQGWWLPDGTREKWAPK